MTQKRYSVYEGIDPRRRRLAVGVTEAADAEELGRSTGGDGARYRILAAGLSLDEARAFARAYARSRSAPVRLERLR